jgi:NTE family protein
MRVDLFNKPMSVGLKAKSRGIGAIGAAMALLTCACQVPQEVVNQPLPNDAAGRPIYSPGYALLPMLKEPKGEIIFLAAFSGGGKRSAAFAHGVLRGLRNIPVAEEGGTRRLIDELDTITAVSGSAPIY